MPEDIWAAIRRDREQGLSLRTLALKYGISKSYIGEMLSTGQSGHAGQPQKTLAERTPPTPEQSSPPVAPTNLSTVIAQNFIRMIAKYATRDGFKPGDVKLEPKDLKLLADTLSQCNKIIVMAEEEEGGEEQSLYDLRTFLAKCTLEELVIIQPVMDAVASRDRANITPMRRTG